MDTELLFVCAYARTKTTKGICRAYHHRKAYAACDFYSIFKAFYSLRYRCLCVNFVEFLDEKVAVLCDHYRLDRCAEHLHAVFVKRAVEIQLSAAVKGSLPSEGQQYAVGTFFLDDFLYKIGSDWQEINLVSHPLGSLYCCNIRVDKYCGNAFLTQGFQCL